MPIYEYACRACEHRFEALVYGGEVPKCPECESKDLEKLFSGFAVGAGDAPGAPPACSSGGG